MCDCYDLSCPVEYYFRNPVEDEVVERPAGAPKNRNLSFGHEKFDPPEVWQCIEEIREWFENNEYEDLCVRDAVINFSYKGVNYRLTSNVLRVSDGAMEYAAKMILEKLKDMGASFGRYWGRLD